MKLVEVDLYDGDWRSIRPQLIEDAYYLIKEKDNHFNHGSIHFYASRISPAGWIHSREYGSEKLNEVLDKPHSWEYSVGTHWSACESSSMGYIMSDEIVGIWLIEDPEYFAVLAKGALSEG